MNVIYVQIFISCIYVRLYKMYAYYVCEGMEKGERKRRNRDFKTPFNHHMLPQIICEWPLIFFLYHNFLLFEFILVPYER